MCRACAHTPLRPLQSAMPELEPAPQYDRPSHPALDLSMASALAFAIDHAAAPPKAAAPIKLADIVRPMGEKRRAVVIDALAIKGGIRQFTVMFRDGATAEYPADELTYVAPALA